MDGLLATAHNRQRTTLVLSVLTFFRGRSFRTRTQVSPQVSPRGRGTSGPSEFLGLRPTTDAPFGSPVNPRVCQWVRGHSSSTPSKVSGPMTSCLSHSLKGFLCVVLSVSQFLSGRTDVGLTGKCHWRPGDVHDRGVTLTNKTRGSGRTGRKGLWFREGLRTSDGPGSTVHSDGVGVLSRTNVTLFDTQRQR